MVCETPNRAAISPTSNANHRTASLDVYDEGIFVFDFETLLSLFSFLAHSILNVFNAPRSALTREFAAAAIVVDGCTKANKEKRWNVKRMRSKKEIDSHSRKTFVRIRRLSTG